MTKTTSVRVAVVYHSGYGHTAKHAEAVAQGAATAGAETLQQLAIFAAQHGMNWFNLGLHTGHNTSTSSEDTLNRHGFFIGAAAQSDADVGAEQGATPADLKTSAHLGARVALAARQMAAGRAVLAALAA